MRCSLAGACGHDTDCPVRDLLILAIHLVITFVKLRSGKRPKPSAYAVLVRA